MSQSTERLAKEFVEYSVSLKDHIIGKYLFVIGWTTHLIADPCEVARWRRCH